MVKVRLNKIRGIISILLVITLTVFIVPVTKVGAASGKAVYVVSQDKIGKYVVGKYSYNKNGLMSKYMNYYSSTWSDTLTMNYGSNNLVSDVHWAMDNSHSMENMDCDYKYTYNSDGKVIAEDHINSAGVVFERLSTTYDGSGNAVLIEYKTGPYIEGDAGGTYGSVDADGTTSYYWKGEYNDMGQLIRDDYVNSPDDEISAENPEYEYNSKGQLIKENGILGVIEYSYDAKGNLIKKVEPDVIYDWKYTYKKGRLVKVTCRDSYHNVWNVEHSFKYKKIRVPANMVPFVEAQQADWAMTGLYNVFPHD